MRTYVSSSAGAWKNATRTLRIPETRRRAFDPVAALVTSIRATFSGGVIARDCRLAALRMQQSSWRPDVLVLSRLCRR